MDAADNNNGVNTIKKTKEPELEPKSKYLKYSDIPKQFLSRKNIVDPGRLEDIKKWKEDVLYASRHS